ncbi:flagella biosynthesis chaperone for FliD, FliT [Shewanella sp.]|uniref:flagella biosynthesis chaperone for FliD, FliT n=1 Tax=Shewanella sp. TaxID=50422 RepID=UPI001ED1DF13|nr:flagella biosynthesis chaperone for FliD, FliT [Shewanella sp.]NRB25138.1 flagella biosynthesis chaperone for FliD, FliT [Shewanella sp.]
MQELNDVNEALSLSLLNLDEIDVNYEQGDELVSDLQNLLGRRQKMLEHLVADSDFDNRAYLEQQLMLTQKYKVQARKVMRLRQSLLQNSKQGQRQINAYKMINSNR